MTVSVMNILAHSIGTLAGDGEGIRMRGVRILSMGFSRFRIFLIKLLLIVSVVNFGGLCNELRYHEFGHHNAPHGRMDLLTTSDYYRPPHTSYPLMTNERYQMGKMWKDARGMMSDVSTLCLLILKILTLACICAMLFCLLLFLCPFIPLLIAGSLLSLLTGLSLIPIIGFLLRPPVTPATPGDDDDDDFMVIDNRLSANGTE